MHESVLQSRIYMLETALRGKNQELQICSALEKMLENRQDKFHARRLKQTAQRHLQMLSKVYRYYKGDAAALLSEKAFLTSDSNESVATIQAIRRETDPAYTALGEISNSRIRSWLRSIREEEKQSIQWYWHVASYITKESKQRENQGKHGGRDEYIQMLERVKNIADTACPDFFEMDRYGSLLVSPEWKSDLEYFVREAHKRNIRVIPVAAIKTAGIQKKERIGMQLARAVRQYCLDGIGIDADYLYSFSQLANYLIIPAVQAKAFLSKSNASKNKIIIGIHPYGYYSKMGDPTGNRKIAAEDMEALLQQYTAAVRFDPQIMQMNATVIIREWEPSLKTCDGNILTPGVYDVWYDTPETIQYKMEYVHQEKLGGAAVYCKHMR